MTEGWRIASAFSNPKGTATSSPRLPRFVGATLSEFDIRHSNFGQFGPVLLNPLLSIPFSEADQSLGVVLLESKCAVQESAQVFARSAADDASWPVRWMGKWDERGRVVFNISPNFIYGDLWGTQISNFE